MRWSQLKKQIASFMDDSVRDRIEFGSTAYRKSHDAEGRGWILIDKKEIINMCSWKFYVKYNKLENEQISVQEKEQKLREQNIFPQWDWHRALFAYLSLSIDDILKSENPIIRTLGMLDARLGKRRLGKIDVSKEHNLVKRLYYLRCDAEKINYLIPASESVNLTTKLDKRACEKRHSKSAKA